MQLNFSSREVAIKLVYYGPALSGKTTNLQSLHALMAEASRGRLMTLETKDDRTLFFDMLPLTFKSEAGGMTVRLKVFTVPGQVLHASTRRLVLQGADGVAFIADSQVSETKANAIAYMDLRDNLKELGRSILDMPVIIQFNKRDMPNIRSDAEIDELAKRGREPIYKASALANKGVIETFLGVLGLAYAKLEQEHQLSQKVGIQRDDFLELVAKSLGAKASVNELIGACVAGRNPAVQGGVKR